MEFKRYDETGLYQTVSQRIQLQLQNKPDSLICIAAGHSSMGVFDLLVQAYQEGAVDFSQAYFVAMDEWLGMNEHTPESCGEFLLRHFLSKVNFPENHICLVNGRNTNTQDECAKIKAFIKDHGGIDQIVLGVGQNGHLALNEPGVDFRQSVHITGLDDTTKRVGTKYFSTSFPELTGGITIGIFDICAARDIILCVNGSHKQQILQRLLTEPVSKDLPATILRTLPHAHLYTDHAAAGLLTQENTQSLA